MFTVKITEHEKIHQITKKLSNFPSVEPTPSGIKWLCNCTEIELEELRSFSYSFKEVEWCHNLCVKKEAFYHCKKGTNSKVPWDVAV